MRLIDQGKLDAERLAKLERIHMHTEFASKVGARIREEFLLTRDPNYPDRVNAANGNKTDAGIARVILRFIDEVEL